MQTRVMESRAFDAHYDSTYTGSFNNPRLDPRVAAAVSSTDMVSGRTRYKYFRRPIAPRMSAMPPNILLAPTKAQDPMIPVEEKPEPLTKNAEMQTAYRDSEAQTQPYTPNYFVPDGEEPDVLMLKDLTFNNGLPLGKKDLQMVEFAKAKRLLESSLPPFTDEASMTLRKKLMENQEMREFRVREAEIDRKREERLAQLQEAINERTESNELLASQRVEAIRQLRMDEREAAMTKIRAKRIKVLRALARKRNVADKQIYSGHERDIVADYFDKASEIYAPIKREGKGVKPDPTKYDVMLRMAPLDTLQNIAALESAIPRSVLNPDDLSRSFSPVKQMSKTEPLGIRNRTRASEDRLTSSGVRALRNTKRDIEEMHNILQKKKRAALLSATQQQQSAQRGSPVRPHSRMPSAPSEPPSSADGAHSIHTPSLPKSPLGKRSTSAGRGHGPSGRPRTPDLTNTSDTADMLAQQPLCAAVVLLQVSSIMLTLISGPTFLNLSSNFPPASPAGPRCAKLNVRGPPAPGRAHCRAPASR